MHSLNRQRANIVLSNLFDGKGILTPDEVSHHERIFEWDGVLRWRGSAPLAKARIGISLQELLSSLAPAHHATGAIRDENLTFRALLRIFKDEGYLLWYDVRQKTVYIVLKEAAPPKTQLKAWALGLTIAHRLEKQDATGATIDKTLHVVDTSLKEISGRWDAHMERMKIAGWDVDIANLETTSGTRIRLHADKS